MNYKKIFLLSSFVLILFACQKTENYVPKPYTCDCGKITWAGIEHDVTGVGASTLLLDSLGMPDQNTRKYAMSVSVADETETNPHNVNAYFEFEDISNVFYYIYTDSSNVDTSTIDLSLLKPNIEIEEIILTADQAEVKNYSAIDGTVEIHVSADGSSDEMSFNIHIKERNGDVLIGDLIPFSGTFEYFYE